MTPAELEARLALSKVLPVLRSSTLAEALDQVECCVSAGLDIIELTTTTPQWAVVLSEAKSTFPGQLFGLGTVLEGEHAIEAISVGADFIVSPCPVPAVRKVTKKAGIPLVEGGMTVGEVLGASRRGIAKLFPAHVVGQRFLSSLLQVRPQARVIPTGGIGLADAASWLQAGALAVGIGRELFSEPDLQASITQIRTTKGNQI